MGGGEEGFFRWAPVAGVSIDDAPGRQLGAPLAAIGLAQCQSASRQDDDERCKQQDIQAGEWAHNESSAGPITPDQAVISMGTPTGPHLSSHSASSGEMRMQPREAGSTPKASRRSYTFSSPLRV